MNDGPETTADDGGSKRQARSPSDSLNEIEDDQDYTDVQDNIDTKMIVIWRMLPWRKKVDDNDDIQIEYVHDYYDKELE